MFWIKRNQFTMVSEITQPVIILQRGNFWECNIYRGRYTTGAVRVGSSNPILSVPRTARRESFREPAALCLVRAGNAKTPKLIYDVNMVKSTIMLRCANKNTIFPLVVA